MDILRTVQDGIEFYTIAATGENGISQSGLARMVGVNKSTISRLENSLLRSSASEYLECFRSKEQRVLHSNGKIIGSFYSKVTIYSVPYCIAVIRHYAIGQSKTNTITAMKTLGRLAEYGLDTLIHQVTGYRQPCEEVEQ